MAAVNTTMTDPPTCASPGGPYSHVYVSVADVEIHQSATAQASDSGWVDLTPSLKSAPKQVDLLALGGNGCVLAQLGSNTQIQPGTYQQIRLLLAPDTASVASNQCGSTNNCVVYNGKTYPLNLSSETQTGIKIPSGQIAGGNFTVAAGQVKGLDINFDACASIILQGSGAFRLKPVLHAGEVALSSNSITGQLVDSGSMSAISGAKEIVALETKDSNGVDRMVMQTTPDSSGNFIFCPVPSGTYDVVAVALTTSGLTPTAYSATITSGVQPGNALGKIPMYAQAVLGNQQGMIAGTVSTAGGTGGIAEDLSLSAEQQLTIAGSSVQVTIPLVQQESTVVATTTAAGSSCAVNTDCAGYTLGLPAALPYLGAFSSSGTTYTQVGGSATNYTVDAQAFQPGSGGTPTCSPTELTTAVQQDGTTSLSVSSGTTVTAKTIAFSGCQ